MKSLSERNFEQPAGVDMWGLAFRVRVQVVSKE